MGKPKVLDLANHIGRKKPNSKSAYTYEDPEYRILEPVVSDGMAEVGLCLEFRKPKSAKEVAPLCGKSLEDAEKYLWELAVAGACFVNEIEIGRAHV